MTKNQALALMELLADLYRVANAPEAQPEPATNGYAAEPTMAEPVVAEP